MKWYIVDMDGGQKLVFQARELSYVYQGHAVFQDVVMADCKMKAYYEESSQKAHDFSRGMNAVNFSNHPFFLNNC